jgi:iron complex transport system ATP-binding protein
MASKVPASKRAGTALGQRRVDPRTSLLDEPTTFLDTNYQIEVLDLLVELNRERGTTIVMVLHELNLAARYADHLIAMRERRIVAAGAPGDVVTAETVHEVFALRCDVLPDPRTGLPLVVHISRHEHPKASVPST